LVGEGALPCFLNLLLQLLLLLLGMPSTPGPLIHLGMFPPCSRSSLWLCMSWRLP
jgi:hypothetical protein